MLENISELGEKKSENPEPFSIHKYELEVQ